MSPMLMPLLGIRAAQAAEKATFWLPPAATEYAKQTDFTFYFIYWIDLVFFIVLMGATLLFTLKYRQRKEGEKTSPTKGSHALEAVWAIFPTFLLFAMFFLGFQGWINQAVPPADAMDIRVTGQKWNWTFQYANGVTTFANVKEGGLSEYDGEGLVVPAGKPVRLTMSSVDVIHSFYVPDFRIKKDVIANRYTVQWFQADEPGEHQVYCTEYCGTKHSRMLSKIRVLAPADYDAWMKAQVGDGQPVSPEKAGEKLFASNGCTGCHSVDGSAMVGPTLKGKYGAKETLEGGATVDIDDNYIRESIMVPAAKIVAGFPPAMPAFQGRLSDEEINNLIAYIKSLQ